MTNQTDATDMEPSAMEYFILALIGKAGLTSLYDFQQHAGLQPGGIRSALERLESWHLIARAEFSARRRRNLSLTEEGTGFLQYSWERSLTDHPDTEAVLRAACVALLMSVPEHAAGYLQGVAFARGAMAKEKKMEAGHLQRTLRDPLSTYLWMRTFNEAQRRNAESETLSQLSLSLLKKDEPNENSNHDKQ